jgi:hypothetical protein
MQTSLNDREGTSHLERLARITRGFPYLQGLKVVPVGLFLLGVTAVGSTWWPWSSRVGKLVSLGLVLATTGGLTRWAGVYYRRRFGQVAPTREQLRRDALGTGLAALAVIAGVVIDYSLEPPVSIFGIALGGFLLWYWSWSGGPRWYHWLAGAAFGAASLLPIVGNRSDMGFIQPGGPIVNLLVAVAGGAYVVVGLLDHLYLVRQLAPAEDGDVESQ